MKNLTLKLATIIACTFWALPYVHAQKKDSTDNKNVTININIGGKRILSHTKKDSLKRDSINKANDTNASFLFGGVTFTRLDIGFSKLVDNGSFALSPTNQFLDYRASKTSHVSFDVLQLGYRLNPQFKIYIAAGFDWTIIRLRQEITMQKNTPALTYITEPINFNKNRFSSSYLHIPLNFEFRTKIDKNGNRLSVVVGPEVGFLLNAKVKQISNERGKVKATDDYNFAPFRFGGTLRVGYKGMGIFLKYYTTDMFDSAPQKGLKNMAFGLTFGLN